MTNGSSQGLFIIVSVVIFGIFVVISYLLFRDKMQVSLSTIYCDSFSITSNNMGLGKIADCGVDSEKELKEVDSPYLVISSGIGGNYLERRADGSEQIDTADTYLNFNNAIYKTDYGTLEDTVYIYQMISPLTLTSTYTVNKLIRDDKQKVTSTIDLSDDSKFGEQPLSAEDFDVYINDYKLTLTNEEITDYFSGSVYNSVVFDVHELYNHLNFKGYSENKNVDFAYIEKNSSGNPIIVGEISSNVDVLKIVTKNKTYELKVVILLSVGAE